MSRSQVLSALAVVMIAFAGHHVITRQQASEQGAPPIAPSESPFSQQVAGVGLVEARGENIKIGTPLSGIVDKVSVVVGQTVKPGDPLFVLDVRQIAADVAAAETRLQVSAGT